MAFGLALADMVRELAREIVRETGVLEREEFRWPSGSRLNPGIVAASHVCSGHCGDCEASWLSRRTVQIVL